MCLPILFHGQLYFANRPLQFPKAWAILKNSSACPSLAPLSSPFGSASPHTILSSLPSLALSIPFLTLSGSPSPLSYPILFSPLTALSYPLWFS